MRRNDKEITDQSTLDAIMRKGQVLRLAMARDNEPYLVPLSYGWNGEAVYFHCATEGKKIDFLKANPEVCFEVEVDVAIKKHETKVCSWGMQFASVIGKGKAVEITDLSGKLAALDHIMAQYSDKKWEYPDKVVDKTMIWKIVVHELTGKQG